MSQTTEPPMPARSDRSAPVFNSADPRELERFFSELENLFINRPSLSQQARKEHAVRFLNATDAEQWKGIPEYDDVAKTFAEFKTAVELAYPTANEKQRYTMYEIDALTGHYSRAGMHSQDDLAHYTRTFRAIARSIIKSGAAGESDLARAYIRGFQPQIWSQILLRLSTTMNNFTPLGPYTIAEINEAATFVMQIQFSVNMAASYLTPGAVASPAAAATAVGSSMIPAPYAVNKTGLTLAPSQSYATPTPPAVKEESPLPTILAQIGTALERLTARMEQGSGSTTRYTQNSSDQDCNFCGGPHFIRDCPIVDDYTRAGKCKRNAENKVVLPSGGFVPRTIPGTLLRDRIEEWHRRNPNQLATGVMQASAMMLNASSPNAIYTQSTEPQPPVRLSVADQVAYHQSAIFKLESRSAGFTPIIKTRNQRQQEASEETSEPVPGPARSTAAPTILTRDPPPHLPTAQSTSRTASARPATPPPAQAASSGLEHPYRNANDAAYAPPQTRNVGAPADKANTPRRDPAYRTLPPVHDPAIAVKIFNQSLETPVTITQRELLSLAPEVRSQYREATTIRRQPSKEATPTTYYERLDYSQFVNADGINGQPPPRGAAIIGDHYDLYYRTLAPGERPDFGMLTVAVESAALRSLHAVVDGTLRVECVIDPGSTIIAMSEEQSTALNLAYDPTIVLKMQSANGAIDPSLGLARNVPFLIGEVTVYLQVHIIRHAPYDVLFGRPFDIITSSVVRNYANEDQTLTIKDVNTGNTATVPTFPRSFRHARRRREHSDPEEGFQR
ncbi:hypothetical protein BJ912DRAFT_894393 [Pholiota molesta]|nr:hypothetical protein BJ912DRAFT_894393 [Pholiota molesta]